MGLAKTSLLLSLALLTAFTKACNAKATHAENLRELEERRQYDVRQNDKRSVVGTCIYKCPNGEYEFVNDHGIK